MLSIRYSSGLYYIIIFLTKNSSEKFCSAILLLKVPIPAKSSSDCRYIISIFSTILSILHESNMKPFIPSSTIVGIAHPTAKNWFTKTHYTAHNIGLSFVKRWKTETTYAVFRLTHKTTPIHFSNDYCSRFEACYTQSTHQPQCIIVVCANCNYSL